MKAQYKRIPEKSPIFDNYLTTFFRTIHGSKKLTRQIRKYFEWNANENI